MRNRLLALILLLTASLALSAKCYTPQTLPVQTSGNQKYVCNPDGILKADNVAVINQQLKQLEDSTSIQILVVAIDSVEGDLYTFAETVANKTGVGYKKHNNGLVVVLATGNRRIQFVTGEGLEGDLPDAICRRIQEQVMNPYFKHNKWNEGLTMGVTALYNQLIGIEDFGQPEKGYNKEDALSAGIVIILIAGLLFLLSGKRHKCPYCGKKTKEISRKRYRQGLSDYYHITCLCPNCKRTSVYNEKVASNSGFIYMGGGGFGGGGGSSNFGGNFGGGSFGGGGAGSSF